MKQQLNLFKIFKYISQQEKLISNEKMQNKIHEKKIKDSIIGGFEILIFYFSFTCHENG